MTGFENYTPTDVALEIVAATAQTANVLKIRKPDGTVLFSVDKDGTCSSYVTGPAGPTGPAGTNGTNGTNGAPGADGAAGAQGIPGIQGIQGPAGADGADGADGTNGTIFTWLGSLATPPSNPGLGNGYYNSTDKKSYVCTNPVGPVWEMFAQDGVDGADGTDGAAGAPGAAGATGPAGADGADGADGEPGPTGPTGANGANGAPGATGPAGPQGPPGSSTGNAHTSYVITTDGTNVYAYNGETGNLDYSGTVTETVINSALTAMTAGGIMCFQRGNYPAILASIVPVSDVEMIGAGWKTIFKVAANRPNVNTHVFAFQSVHNCLISDIKIDGDRGTANANQTIRLSQSGVNIIACQNIIVDRMYICNMTEEGIYIGKDTTPCENIVSHDCKLVNCFRNGIGIVSATDVWIYNPHIDGCCNNGCDWESNATTSLMWNLNLIGGEIKNINNTNTPYTAGCAVYLSGHDYRTHGGTNIVNVNMHDCQGPGVVIRGDGATGGFRDTVIDGCKIYHNGLYGTYGSGGIDHNLNLENIVVKNCHIFDNRNCGYILTNTSAYIKRNLRVEGCHIYNNGNYDVRVYGASGSNIEHFEIIDTSTHWDSSSSWSQSSYGIRTEDYLINSTIRGCRGYGHSLSPAVKANSPVNVLDSFPTNYLAAASVSTSGWSSPATITNGQCPATYYIVGGTISLVTVDGRSVGTERSITVRPWGTVVITYSSIPTIEKVVN